MSKLLGIGHVHLKVSDLKKAEKFYTKLLGFKVNERVNNYLFLTLGKKHHDLALQEVVNAKKPSENNIGLYHFAIEAKNLKELVKLYFKLKKEKIDVSPIDHGISKTLYFSDPDGNGIEIYVDTRNIRKKWKGLSKIIPENEFKN
ncbi:MAG: VOC family protein [Nanoarchaeota archaeon]|nr:VOC family protein [Nanoarchaeota archaeon]